MAEWNSGVARVVVIALYTRFCVSREVKSLSVFSTYVYAVCVDGDVQAYDSLRWPGL